ncbi:MAG: BamA/TamA family outer membrane protein [Lachnoclostridium sp.]|nr:BamA/TamA family outer membrane protein [Lachnoclostridium sp.]
MRRIGNIFLALLCGVLALCLGSCSTTRHVPEGKYLLDHVDISIEGDETDDVKTSELVNYLRQTPNHKVLGFLKLQLATYNMSGKDSTKWYNRWVRRMGQPPVIYDEALTEASARQLRLALVNRGFMETTVMVDSFPRPEKKKMDIVYHVTPRKPHRISTIGYEIPDTAISAIIMRDTLGSTIRPGMYFDRNELDAERVRLTERLRNAGYYSFNKEYITFYADTAENSKEVNLTMLVNPPRRAAASAAMIDSVAASIHDKYYIRSVYIVTDYQGGSTPADFRAFVTDSVEYKDVTILYGKDHYLTPGSLEEKCFLIPGHLYRSAEVDRTYESLARLGILRAITIDFVPVGGIGNTRFIDAYILLQRNKKQSVTFDVEGTNSEGDLGFGLGLTYQHRNLAHGSQLLTTRLRMNYESLSGNFNGLINDRYTEYAAEVGITFPRFEFPFATRAMKQRFNVSTEFAVSFNFQERPEYTRIIAGGAWKYRWVNRENTRRHIFNLVDINYVYLPERTNDFLDMIAPDNPLLRYSYEDHFIMSMSYSYYRTNRRIASTMLRNYNIQPSIYTIRASIETAGNLLYALSEAFAHPNAEGVYDIFGIQFSQYAKAEVDYTLTRNFTRRHSLSFHVGAGLGVPYGNSTVLPFEKRFYAGGANGVRGWGVRTLGPGSYDSQNSVTSFINQCGDIRLDLSLEYRAKLFWVLEGGVFVDAGNIWTIKNYENQPGGVFKFDEFYKQIALAYGVGLRMDFTYFLLRLDLGFKAHNPAMNQERWPLLHPNWHRDATFHFAVGYPF